MISPELRPTILVLMPVYNGGAYLVEQFDSILGQIDVNCMLLVRDDNSSDDSGQILQRYATEYPQQVTVVEDDAGNLGAAASFNLLMQRALRYIDENSKSQPYYVALADQDDVWHTQKLSRCLQCLLEIEKASESLPVGAATPVLVHSDLRVVDKHGQVIAPSLLDYQMLRVRNAGFVAQLVSNTLTGCTAVMNAALLRKALPVPPEAVMHDWWLSLVASAFGKRGFVAMPLVDYRQHGSNTLGARAAARSRFSLSRMQALLANRDTEETSQLFKALAVQARCFASRYGTELGAARRWTLRRVTALEHSGALVRRLVFRLFRRL